jgi:hypothetical protein
MVGLRGGFDNRQNLERVKELNNVNPALSTFDSGHE